MSRRAALRSNPVMSCRSWVAQIQTFAMRATCVAFSNKSRVSNARQLVSDGSDDLRRDRQNKSIGYFGQARNWFSAMAKSQCRRRQAEGAPKRSTEMRRIRKANLMCSFGERMAGSIELGGAFDPKPQHIGFKRQLRLRDVNVARPL